MAQVFISYSRSEKQTASLLAQRLTDAGYDVWWDAEILGGTRFEDEINQALRNAPVAVILWSKSAAASDWVRAEAEVARHRKSALPVIIDDVDITALPILYQQIHIIELRNWDGNAQAPGYQQILKTLKERLEPNAGDGPAAAIRPASKGAQSTPTPTLTESDAWAELMQLKDATADDYRDFLTAYPKGQFAGVAQMRLKRLERRSGRFWRLIVGGVAAVAVVVGVAAIAAPSVRDRLFSLLPHDATACPVESVVTLTLLTRVQLCADNRIWQPFTVAGTLPGTLNFASTGGISVQITPMAQPITPDLVKTYYVRTSDPSGVVNVTAQGNEVINDRQWITWHWTATFASLTTSYITYYYSSPQLGGVVLTFFGAGNDDLVHQYATPMMGSIKF